MKTYIGSWQTAAVLALVMLLDMSGVSRVMALDDCRWAGTSPVCDGECKSGETEVTRLSTPPGGGAPPAYYGPPFGAACATGSKVLCCKSATGATCRWDGTAPFCAGECRSGEREGQPPVGSSGGKACWTGSKVYCCKSTSTGSSGASLETRPKFTRYAALWVKRAGPAWQARHGLSSAQYQQEFSALAKQGYRLVAVNGYGVGDQVLYAAIWEKRDGPAWAARHGLTSAQYQDAFNTYTQQGYRLVDISGYSVGGQERYAAIWEKRDGPAWAARHGLTSAQYQDAFNTYTQQGYRLVDISGYSVGGQERYAAIWEKRQGPAWAARHGLTSAQYQDAFNTYTQQGYRLVDVSAYSVGSQDRYAAIWEKMEGKGWVARHRMLADAYQKEFDALVKEGYRLSGVSGYHTYD